MICLYCIARLPAQDQDKMQQGNMLQKITIQNRDFLPVFLQKECNEHSNSVECYSMFIKNG